MDFGKRRVLQLPVVSLYFRVRERPYVSQGGIARFEFFFRSGAI